MFAESPALDKELLCRVPEFAESQALGKVSFTECWVWRSAKWLFAECPSFATRQTSTHSAKIQFPVVVARGYNYLLIHLFIFAVFPLAPYLVHPLEAGFISFWL